MEPGDTGGFVAYNSYAGTKPAAIGDPAKNFLWIGTVGTGPFPIFDRSGNAFVSGPANWAGLITQFFMENGAWVQGGAGSSASQVAVTEPNLPPECVTVTPSPSPTPTPSSYASIIVSGIDQSVCT